MLAMYGVSLLAEQKSLLDVQGWTMVWTFVWFLALLVVLGRFAWKPLLQSLEKREQAIRDTLDRAEKAKQEAEAILAEHKRRMDQADAEVKRLLEEGRKQATALKEGILEEARNSAKSTVNRATREIELAREDALQSIRKEAIELSVALAGKVIGRSLNPKDHEELIRSSMKELKV